MGFDGPGSLSDAHLLSSFASKFLGSLALLGRILVCASLRGVIVECVGASFLCGMSFPDVGFSLGCTAKAGQAKRLAGVNAGCLDFNLFVGKVFMSWRGLSWSGSFSWLAQRCSVFGIILFFGVIISGVLMSSSDYTRWHEWWLHPVVRFLLLFGGGSILIHQWVGVRDILMDYVHPAGWRRFLYAVVVLVLFLELIEIVILALGTTA